MLYRRCRVAKIKNINIIQRKLKDALIVKKDNFQQVFLKVYQIGVDNSFTDVVVFSGNILDVLQWCKVYQNQMKSLFDGYLNNIRNNSDKNSILKYTKKMLQRIQSSDLYDDKCFKMVKKFVKQFSKKNNNLKDSDVVGYIEGKYGIKKQISVYRQLVTKDRVRLLQALYSYYMGQDKKQNYVLGISGIEKAIQNNQILNINLKKRGKIRVRPEKIQLQKWVMLGQQLDQKDQVIRKVFICQSDVDK